MQIRLNDRELSTSERYEKAKLLAETDQPFDFGGFIIIDNEPYTMCSCNPAAGILLVEPTELNESPEEEYGEFTCPYCGYEDTDAIELSDDGETQCGNCLSELKYERHITIEYNVTPVKVAPILRIESEVKP